MTLYRPRATWVLRCLAMDATRNTSKRGWEFLVQLSGRYDTAKIGQCAIVHYDANFGNFCGYLGRKASKRESWPWPMRMSSSYTRMRWNGSLLVSWIYCPIASSNPSKPESLSETVLVSGYSMPPGTSVALHTCDSIGSASNFTSLFFHQDLQYGWIF